MHRFTLRSIAMRKLFAAAMMVAVAGGTGAPVVAEIVVWEDRVAPLQVRGNVVFQPVQRFERGGRGVRRVPVRRPAPKKVMWEVPQGKFGLMLNDGTRIIGQPSADWSAAVKSEFGMAVIPLAQIRSIEANGSDSVAIHLNNGDRVSGPLVSPNIPFETPFGKLDVPSSDLVRLTSQSVSLSDNATTAVAPQRPDVPTRMIIRRGGAAANGFRNHVVPVVP
jgi:hypothetical protein